MKKYPLTPNQLNEIKRDYHNTLTKELAQRCGCSISCIYNLAHSYGLKKDIDLIRETARIRISDPNHGGRKSLFLTGHHSHNKGKKQPEYMSVESISKSAETRFKKGHLPTNHKPLGYERITKDGYIEVKTKEPNVFKLKHRMIWEQYNGPIPNGYNIQFKDRNRQNTTIDNLYLISRSDQLKNENGIYCYPEELANIMRLKGALKRQINKKRKNE